MKTNQTKKLRRYGGRRFALAPDKPLVKQNFGTKKRKGGNGIKDKIKDQITKLFFKCLFHKRKVLPTHESDSVCHNDAAFSSLLNILSHVHCLEEMNNPSNKKKHPTIEELRQCADKDFIEKLENIKHQFTIEHMFLECNNDDDLFQKIQSYENANLQHNKYYQKLKQVQSILKKQDDTQTAVKDEESIHKLLGNLTIDDNSQKELKKYEQLIRLSENEKSKRRNELKTKINNILSIIKILTSKKRKADTSPDDDTEETLSLPSSKKQRSKASDSLNPEREGSSNH